MGENGHKMSEEEKRADLKKRADHCQAKLEEFARWLLTLHDYQLLAIRDNASEVAAYYMSKSPHRTAIILDPDILLDMVSLMLYSLWEGMDIAEAKKEKERE